jgi:hypothetical protein
VPIALLRWILCGIAFALSGYFLVANIYPVLVSVRHLSLIPCIIHTSTLNAGGPKVDPVSDCRGRGATCGRGALIQAFILQLLHRRQHRPWRSYRYQYAMTLYYSKLYLLLVRKPSFELRALSVCSCTLSRSSSGVIVWGLAPGSSRFAWPLPEQTFQTGHLQKYCGIFHPRQAPE